MTQAKLVVSIMLIFILDLVYTANRALPHAPTISRAPVFHAFFTISLDASLVSGSRKKEPQKAWEEEAQTFEDDHTQYNESLHEELLYQRRVL